MKLSVYNAHSPETRQLTFKRQHNALITAAPLLRDVREAGNFVAAKKLFSQATQKSFKASDSGSLDKVKAIS